MIRKLLIPGLLFFASALNAAADDLADIRRTLEVQVAEWNRGDLKAFVSYYTEDCAFVGTEVRRGRAQVLDRYMKRYPNKDTMGKTTFSDLEITKVGKNNASVIGRWKVERPEQAGGNVGGYFTLLLVKIKKDWKIQLDHTS
jgi:ketosteroid isomerase-like protein